MIGRVGQAKSNNQVFAELLDRLELSKPGDLIDDTELSRALLGNDLHTQLLQTGELAAAAGPRPVQMKDISSRDSQRQD